MKINFLYLMFLFVALSSGVNAFDDSYEDDDSEETDESQNACDINPTVALDLDALTQTGCDLDWGKSSRRKSEACACLDEAANKNILISLQRQQTPTASVDLGNRKNEYKERFFDIYEKMTMQDSIQAEILGINPKKDKEKNVGCSAQRISNDIKVKTASAGSTHKEALTKLLTEKLKEKDKCEKRKKDCKQITDVIAQINVNLANLAESVDPCQISLTIFKEDMSPEKILKMKEFYSKNGDSSSLEKLNFLDKLFYNHGPGVTMKPGQLNIYAIKLKNASFGSLMKDACQFINSFNLSTLKPFENAQKVPGSESLNLQCEPGDTLCETLNNRNNQISENKKNNYKANSADCMTRAEYDTFKSMPGPELLKALAKERDPGKLLSIPSSSESALDKEKIVFLRNNPIITKLASDSNFKSQLGKLLQGVAKTSEAAGATDEDKFRAYLKFMQSDVKKLLELPEAQATNLNVCNSLSDNFAAIQVANDLPEVDKKIESDTYSSQLNYALRSCKAKSLNEAATTDSKAFFSTSPLFTLGLTEAETNLDPEGYEKLKAVVCKDYNQAYADKSCDKKMDDNCRKQYLSSDAAQAGVRGSSGARGFFNNAAGAAMAATKSMIDTKSINSSLTSEQMNRVVARNDETKQDHSFISWWDKNVGSRLSKQVIATKGEGNKFIADQKRNTEIASNTKIPDRFNNSVTPDISPVASAPGIVAPPVSSDMSNLPGQQIPEYSKDLPSFDPSKLASAKGPKDLIPNFEQLPPVEQKQSLSDVKKFIASQENPPFPEKMVDQELSQVNQKIANNIEEIEKKIQKISNPNTPSVASGSVGQNSSMPNFSNNSNNGFSPQSMPSSNVSNNSSAGSAKVSSSGSASNATNKALIQANEAKNLLQDALNEGRSPASLKVDGGINFQKGVYDPALLQPGLLVKEEVLIPSTHEEYEKIKDNLSDLKSYLAGQIDVKDLTEPKILKIKDPKESPNSYILFYVSKGPTGLINVKTVNRKSTLRELNNTL